MQGCSWGPKGGRAGEKAKDGDRGAEGQGAHAACVGSVQDRHAGHTPGAATWLYGADLGLWWRDQVLVGCSWARVHGRQGG